MTTEQQTPPKAPCEAELRTITVAIEGGIVQDIQGIPPGYQIKVRDFDDEQSTEPVEETIWRSNLHNVLSHTLEVLIENYAGDSEETDREIDELGEQLKSI